MHRRVQGLDRLGLDLEVASLRVPVERRERDARAERSRPVRRLGLERKGGNRELDAEDVRGSAAAPRLALDLDAASEVVEVDPLSLGEDVVAVALPQAEHDVSTNVMVKRNCRLDAPRDLAGGDRLGDLGQDADLHRRGDILAAHRD